MMDFFERMKVYKQLMDEQRKREQEERDKCRQEIFCDYLDNSEVVAKKQVLEYNPEKEKMAWREYKIYSRNVQIDFYDDFSDYAELLKALFSDLLVSVSYSKQELSFTLASWID